MLFTRCGYVFGVGAEAEDGASESPFTQADLLCRPRGIRQECWTAPPNRCCGPPVRDPEMQK